MPSKKKKYNARFPAGRIKKIMQSDEEVGKVAQAVPIIISRTLELFVESLLQKTLRITTARNAKTLSPSHMRQCIMSENRFDFLRELVKNVPDINVAEEQHQHQQQHPQAASTSSAGGRRPSPDSDDDVEFVSGNSTPTSSPAAAAATAAFAMPTDLSNRASLAAASVVPSTSNGSGHKRNAVGDLVAAPAQQQPPAYFSGLQPMTAPPSPYPTVASHSQQSLDLSAVAAERSAPSSSIAANYYTEIDTNTTNTTVAAVPQPQQQQQQQPALLRSSSTPAAASNYYANAINPTTSLTPTLQAAQPPVINFDFSKGLTNSSILYTAPSVVAQPQQQQQQPQVPTTIVNVAIDQLTQTPLVKIDYSQLNFDTPSATISTPSMPTPQAVVVATSPSLPPPAPEVVKPRRGRPPKVRPILTVGPVGQTLPAAPLSAPVRACAPYTPPTAEDYGRSAASSSSSSSSTSLSSPALYKYQKSTKTFVRSSSSSGSKNHHHHHPAGDASASTSSVTPAAAPLLMASPASMLAPPPLSLGIAAGSCLDMDEDYDNI